MPFPFQAILVAGATGYLLTAVLFLITRRMPRVDPGAGWWAVSSFAAGVGYVALLALGMQGRPDLGEAVYNMLFVVWVTALYLGGAQFVGRPVGRGRLVAGAAAVALWVGWFSIGHGSFLPAAVVVALYCGGFNLALAWLFARHLDGPPRLKWVLVAALAISGLHWLDYPLLRPVDWFAPIGFSLCAVIAVAISGLLAGLVLIQYRVRMDESEQAAVFAASHDPLTQLKNRLALDVQFEHALAECQRSGRHMAVMVLDLDYFKPINDRLGHAAGDAVLTAVARRIESVVRQCDIVARTGGDEFVIILTDLGPPGEAAVRGIADKLLQAVAEPIAVAGETCRVAASIGISHYPAQGDSLGDLLHLADKAMYAGKHKGRGAVGFAG